MIEFNIPMKMNKVISNNQVLFNKIILQLVKMQTMNLISIQLNQLIIKINNIISILQFYPIKTLEKIQFNPHQLLDKPLQQIILKKLQLIKLQEVVYKQKLNLYIIQVNIIGYYKKTKKLKKKNLSNQKANQKDQKKENQKKISKK